MTKSSQMSGYLVPKKNVIKELYWDGLISDPNNTFDLIYSFYTSSNRHYHNINHIVSCQQQLDDFIKHYAIEENFHPHKIIRLALWFHDIIYDTRLNNNEELSSILARELLSRFSEITDGVCELISFTKHNRLAQNADEELISDIDLSIFGTFNSEYQKYSEAIRLEYGWVPDYMYYNGRL